MVLSERREAKAICVPATNAGRTFFRRWCKSPSLRAGISWWGDGAACGVVAACGADVAIGGDSHRMWWEARVTPSFFIRLRRVLG